jgi:putative oxidoreductase
MSATVLGRLAATSAPSATILIRIVVGGVFLTEGIQKFLYPADLGAGRFAKIGIPVPEMMGPFVGGIEIICGALVILGLLARIAAILLLIDISVAIVSTKIPILLGHGFWGLSLAKLPRYGFLSMIHEARADLAMWFGLLFLLIVGAGRKWSLDAKIATPTSDSRSAR